jgi:hypothetical protein
VGTMTEQNKGGGNDSDGFFDPARDGDALPDDIPVTPPGHPAAARDGDPLDKGPRTGKSHEEKAEEPAEAEEQGDGQIAWVIEEDGRKISLGQLVQRGTPVLYHYSMTGKAIPDAQGGLIDPYARTVPLVVDGVPEDVKVSYVRNQDRSVKEVHVYMKIAARIVYQGLSEAATVFLNEQWQEVAA